MKRDSNFQVLSWFTDHYRMGNLDLEPPYQRKSVWSNDYKVYFIDTILRNFPCPTIFLQVERSPSGITKYYVVDGKQRLLTILEFITGKFTTIVKYSDPALADKYFSELPDPVKVEFWGYKFTVEYISGASTSELTQSFDRLNRNVLKLNNQELRHAKYSGEFITFVTQLADDPFWHDMGMSTTSRIRRMLDIEYVSEIFLVVMHGIKDGREHLDDYYAEYDDGIPDLERNRRKYEVCKTLIAELDIYKERYRNLADQYSLWSAMSKLYDEHSDSLEIDIERTRENLLQFAPKVKEDTEDELGKAYTLAVLQASNSIKSRETREEILKGLIVVKEK